MSSWGAQTSGTTKVIRIHLYNRSFLTFPVPADATASEVLEQLLPRIRAKGQNPDRMKLYVVEDDVERPLEDNELIVDIKDKWATMGVANSDKYIFMAHEPNQEFVPFSKPLPAEREGWLMKKSGGRDLWQKRWLRLTGTSLAYLKQPTDAEPRGSIELAGAQVLDADAKSGKRHCFEIRTADRAFYLYADSQSEKDAWMGSFEGRASSVIRGETALHALSQSARESLDGGHRTSISDGASPAASAAGSVSGDAGPLRVNEPACEGWMEKSGGMNPAYKRRYFVLRDGILSYHTAVPKAWTVGSADKTLKGTIDLSVCTLRPDAQRPHTFEVVLGDKDRVHHLATDGPASFIKWYAAMREYAQNSDAMTSAIAEAQDQLRGESTLRGAIGDDEPATTTTISTGGVSRTGSGRVPTPRDPLTALSPSDSRSRLSAQAPRSSLTSGVLSPTAQQSAAAAATRGLTPPVSATRSSGGLYASSGHLSGGGSGGVGGGSNSALSARSPSISYTSRPSLVGGAGVSARGRTLTQMDRGSAALEPTGRREMKQMLREPLLEDDDKYYSRNDLDDDVLATPSRRPRASTGVANCCTLL